MAVEISLAEIAAVLGCSKSTACRIRAGGYDKESELPARYAAPVAVVERVERETAKLDVDSICYACPRDDCTGCRVAEVVTG
jgi:hypothetical protein